MWINREIAKILDQPKEDKMRESFYIALSNSRGVSVTDGLGEEELEIAFNYDNKAKDLKEYGFYNLAKTVSSLVESYRQMAERMKHRLI